MPSPGDLYTAPASEVDYELVRAFVLNAEAANLFSESPTFEAKEKRNGSNVAEAVAALSNADGGVILVGVKDKDATGEDRIVGVPKSEHDALASYLHAFIPEAMPEIIPVAMPGGQKLVLVLRVDADAVPHPVMVSGKVLFRIPGHSVPSRQAPRPRPRGQGPGRPGHRAGQDERRAPPLAPDGHGPMARRTTREGTQLRSGVLRVAGGLELPRRVLDRPWLGLAARQAALDALNNSPLQLSPHWFLTTWDTVEARATDLRLFAGEVNAGHLPRPGRGLPPPGRPQALDAGRLPVDRRGRVRGRHGDGALLPRPSRGDDHDRIHEPRTWQGPEAWPSPATRSPGKAGSSRKTTWQSPTWSASEASAPTTATTHRTGHFPEARAAGTDIEDLNSLARDWLTYWLLDMGSLGPRDFETWIAAWPRPDFLRMPDLALPTPRPGQPCSAAASPASAIRAGSC